MGSMSPLAGLEKKLIYHPQKMPDELQLPQSSGIEDANFQSADGTKLNGWFIDHPKRRAVALWLHGNAGNIASRAPTLNLLNKRHQLAVMVFDYRGYGRSEGEPSEQGILMDARAARKWLAERTGVSEQEIVLMGRSLGGGVAVDLAAKDGAHGLVLVSTFTSLPQASQHHFPYLPTSLLMTQRLDSLAKISQYHGPLLQSHGEADKVIPYRLGKQLFDAANEPKRLISIPGGGHNDRQPEMYRVAFDEFIDSLP